MRPNYDELEEVRILPNGVDVVGNINNNIIHNLRLNGAARINLPSCWRMARLVCEESTGLLLYHYPVE